MSNTVDARGLSCPEPVILTRNALEKQSAGEVKVRVSAGAARDNVTRLAQKLGWQVEIETDEEGFLLIITK